MVAPDIIPTYGVTQRAAATALDVHAEEIRLIGFTVLDSGLSLAQIASLRDRVVAISIRQDDEFGGRDKVAAVDEKQIRRVPYWRMRSPEAGRDAFCRAAAHAAAA